MPPTSVVPWLLDSDPAIRWQVMRDLTDASPSAVAAERARVATEGWGAQLLAMQATDGTWGGGAWNRGWDSTMHALMLLRDFGLDPESLQARRTMSLVQEHVTWRGCGPDEVADNRFFEGEVEPCINGQVALAGAYFGANIHGIIERLLGEQLADDGWNCEAERGSKRSSFNTTICVLEALLEYETSVHAGTEDQNGPRPSPGRQHPVTEARHRGEDYLLERRLMRRKSTGVAITGDRKGGWSWSRFAFPTWWHYDVLRGLNYLRLANVRDSRMADAVDLVLSKRDASGRWSLDTAYPGRMLIDMGEREGVPSRWITHRALSVLKWSGMGS